jgi:hypothetical protein
MCMSTRYYNLFYRIINLLSMQCANDTCVGGAVEVISTTQVRIRGKFQLCMYLYVQLMELQCNYP